LEIHHHTIAFLCHSQKSQKEGQNKMKNKILEGV